MGTLDRFTRESRPSANSPAPYTGTLKPPVCAHRQAHGACVWCSWSSQAPWLTHTTVPNTPRTYGLGLAEAWRGSDAGEVYPPDRGCRAAPGTLCPFEWTKCTGLRGETLEPQSSQTIVQQDWAKEGRLAALPCPGYGPGPGSEAFSPSPGQHHYARGSAQVFSREEDRDWLLSDLVTRSHFVG